MQTVQPAAARSRCVDHAPWALAEPRTTWQAHATRPTNWTARRFSLLVWRGADGVVRASGSLATRHKQQTTTLVLGVFELLSRFGYPRSYK